jgi:hypothetical protein
VAVVAEQVVEQQKQLELEHLEQLQQLSNMSL